MDKIWVMSQLQFSVTLLQIQIVKFYGMGYFSLNLSINNLGYFTVLF